MIIPIMAMAGSLAAKKISPPSAGTFPVAGVTFVVLLLGNRAAGRRVELPARPDPRTNRRTLPHGTGEALLNAL